MVSVVRGKQNERAYVTHTGKTKGEAKISLLVHKMLLKGRK